MGVTQSLTLTESSYSVSNNSSQVRILWKSTQTGNSWNGYTRTAKYWISINGGSETPKTVSYTLPKKATTTIVDATIKVGHKSDGSGTVSVRTWMDTDIDEGVVTKETTLNLTTIPRASGLSVSGTTTLGSTQTIKADRKASRFRHILTYKCGTHEGTIADKTSTATSWTYTPALSWADGAPYGDKVQCSFKLSTYDGDTLIGSASKAVWYAIPSSVKPSCSLSLTDTKGYEKKYGGYIYGKSKLKVTINETTAGGSPISKYATVVGGVTYTSKSFTTNVPKPKLNGQIYEQPSISTTITDGRGRTATDSKQIDVILYDKPKISNVKAHRCNADGVEDMQGSYGKIEFHCKITQITNNSKACKLQYRQSGTSQWKDGPSITLSSYEQDCSPGVIQMADDHSYELRITLEDSFESVYTDAVISTAYSLFHIPANGKGITFGGISEGNGFHVNMSATFYKSVDIRNRIYMGGNKKTDDEKQIFFQSTDSANNPHSVQLYGGNGSSENAFGIYDSKNTRSIMSYKDASNKMYVGANTHFDNGLTEDIRILTSGNCNTLITSGNYYIGNSGSNRPITQNGWLTVKSMDNGNYCFQEYITNSGKRYRRIRDNGTWGNWIQEADYVVEQGVSSNWHYQKWNSGLIKLWRKMTSSNLLADKNGTVNGWYYRLYTITIPDGLLKKVTIAMCNCKWGTGLSFASAREVTTTSFQALYFSNQNGGEGTFYHEVTGTWK